MNGQAVTEGLGICYATRCAGWFPSTSYHVLHAGHTMPSWKHRSKAKNSLKRKADSALHLPHDMPADQLSC